MLGGTQTLDLLKPELLNLCAVLSFGRKPLGRLTFDLQAFDRHFVWSTKLKLRQMFGSQVLYVSTKMSTGQMILDQKALFTMVVDTTMQ